MKHINKFNENFYDQQMRDEQENDPNWGKHGKGKDYINFLRSLTKHTKSFNDVWYSKPDGGGSRRNVTHPWTYYLKNGELKFLSNKEVVYIITSFIG